MAKHNELITYALWGGAIYGGIYLISQLLPQATPLSIYPEFSYTATTSMATNPKQVAATAAIPPTGQFQTEQEAEMAALYSQCAGSWPSCTPILSDTQLGF